MRLSRRISFPFWEDKCFLGEWIRTMLQRGRSVPRPYLFIRTVSFPQNLKGFADQA